MKYACDAVVPLPIPRFSFALVYIRRFAPQWWHFLSSSWPSYLLSALASARLTLPFCPSAPIPVGILSYSDPGPVFSAVRSSSARLGGKPIYIHGQVAEITHHITFCHSSHPRRIGPLPYPTHPPTSEGRSISLDDRPNSRTQCSSCLNLTLQTTHRPHLVY